MPTIEKVTYEKVFPLAPYVNEKIGVIYILNEGDDPKEVLQSAKDLCEEFHRDSITASLSHQFEQPQPPEISVLPSIQVDKPIEEMSLKEHIMSCKELKVLETYYMIVKNNEDLKGFYGIRKQQLVAKESKGIIDNTNALCANNILKAKQLQP